MQPNANLYRQGDIMLERIDTIPAGAKEEAPKDGRIVLAYGEVTGHAHAFYGKGVRYFAPNDQGVAHIRVEGEEPAMLQHEEHSTIPVPPGAYRVIRQREYHPEELRTVAD